MSNQINQKRIAKNTLMLYIRMGVAMLVSLYTSRVVLSTLGVEDFGIYNVVGGIVILFSFLNTTLTVAIRRFLAYEIGRSENCEVQKVLNLCNRAVLLSSVIILIGLETIGLWFLNSQLNIPDARMESANFVYQFSILTFFVNMNIVPYSSTIVVYEKMDVYAYFGIAEIFFKLVLVILLSYMPGDKLKWFGIFVLLLTSLSFILNYVYCKAKLIKPVYFVRVKWQDLSPIFKFSVWTVLGTMVYMMATQGVNMIYNVFWGVAINAAMGVANQVSGAVNQFIGNFQTAFNPQLTKSFSSEGLSERTFSFVCQTSRLTILLILIIGIPIIANAESLLNLWLEKVPQYAVPFSVIFIIYLAIDGSAGPLYLLVYAKGDLKKYQILMGMIQLIYVSLVWVGCFIGLNPVTILSFNIITALMLYMMRLFLLKELLQFPIKRFVHEVVYPLFWPIVFLIVVTYTNIYLFHNLSLVFLLINITFIICIVGFILYIMYLKEDERNYLVILTKKVYTRCLNLQ